MLMSIYVMLLLFFVDDNVVMNETIGTNSQANVQS
jgi:hypothetical protein